jgi:hypothetical protein
MIYTIKELKLCIEEVNDIEDLKSLEAIYFMFKDIENKNTYVEFFCNYLKIKIKYLLKI